MPAPSTKSLTTPRRSRGRDPGRYLGLGRVRPATGSTVDRRLTELITDQAAFGVADAVRHGSSRGARSEERGTDLPRPLVRFDLLRFDAASDFDDAAQISRAFRRIGVTPRTMVDRMIASVARRHAATIAAQEAALSRVAQPVGIDIDVASLSAN